ncbi:MAG: cob(I)yrinic acid a,c-diamide adenosyltransferase [Pseudomonadota bacterium]
MGNRLSKIYTRTGDSGTTGLGNGERIEKDHIRVESYGTTDELNSHIGCVLACDVPDNIRDTLTRIQHHLFDIGGELCIPDHVVITDEHVSWVESRLDELNEDLPYLKEFILPGGNMACSHCHVARTVCRRAERNAISLSRVESINPVTIKYLNRLSDYLFVAARVLARVCGDGEVYWKRSTSTDFS